MTPLSILHAQDEKKETTWGWNFFLAWPFVSRDNKKIPTRAELSYELNIPARRLWENSK